MTGGADPCGAVDREPGVPPIRRNRLTGVDSHPDSQLRSVGPFLLCERPLRVDCGENRFARVCERDEEGIALGVDFVPAMACECLAEQRLVRGQRLRIAFTEPRDELSRAIDIREQEGDCPGWRRPDLQSLTWITSSESPCSPRRYLHASKRSRQDPQCRRCRPPWYRKDVSRRGDALSEWRREQTRN